MARVIGIISIKGGVGKTSSVCAIGAALAREFEQKVLLVDANFSAPNLGLHVGVVDPQKTIHHVIGSGKDPHSAIYETEYGFHLMPGALIGKEVNPFALKALVERVRDEYDFILIDSSPALNEEILATMVASDELFVVSTPDHVTLSTTLRAVRLAKQKKTPITGILLNKVYKKGFELSVKDVEDAAGCKVLAVLPHDVSVVEALAKNVPFTVYKETDAAVEYKKLAGVLLGKTYDEKGVLRRLKRMFNKNVSQAEVNRAILREEFKY